MAKKKSNNKVIYIALGVLGVIIVVLLIGKSQGWVGAPNEINVELAASKRASITEIVSASGTVQPVIEVKLAPEVSGEIIALAVEDGDQVKEGDVLVKINPDVLTSQLERMEASLSQQKANLESTRASLQSTQATFNRAEADYNRQEKLWDERVISESDWQTALQNYLVAKSNLASAVQSLEGARFSVSSTEASVREARDNVRRTTVVAPMTGIVTKLNVKAGERVVGTTTMAGTEMLRIADLNNMEVRVNVNENDIIRVHIGDSVGVDIDAYSSTDKRFKGIVTNIANTAKDKTSADAITEFEVRIGLLSSSYQDLVESGNAYPFRPGMTASVEIITAVKNDVLSVPLAAVTTRNPNALNGQGEAIAGESNTNTNNDDRVVVNEGQQQQATADLIVVFVNDNGKAKIVEVETGISDYDNVEIISGIEEGMEVVTGPFLVVSSRLNNGDLITKTEDSNNSATP